MTSALQQLREMYAYMQWADNRVLDAAGGLSDEGFRREQHISAGSIHKLLLHVMGAQWLWLEVRVSNHRAQKVYERYGYRRVGDRKNYYPAEHGHREDAIVMSYKL